LSAIPSPASPASPGAQVLPRIFGRYALFDRIGRGGMAEIFLARAKTELGGARLVVVKQILPELAENASFAELLVTEAKLAARLSHGNVVQVLDLGRHEGRLFIAMEYIEGFDLSDILRTCSKTKTPLPLDFALHIVIEMLRGLDYAHRRTDEQGRPLGLVHRDVSPSNVLVSVEGEVKLCDFGIAHANEAAGGRADDAIQGKAGYMSPEHARGEPLDARADVFAAGIILWEMLAGRRYYRAQSGESPLELARRAPYQDPPARGLPGEEELVAIVRRSLAPVRDERFASAQAMLRELEGYVGRSGLIASSIRLGEWMRETFGGETIEGRRARERALRAIEAGPLVELQPTGSTLPEDPGEGQIISLEDEPPLVGLSELDMAKTIVEMRAPTLEELRGDGWSPDDDQPAMAPIEARAAELASPESRAGGPASIDPTFELTRAKPARGGEAARAGGARGAGGAREAGRAGEALAVSGGERRPAGPFVVVAAVVAFVVALMVAYRVFAP
jgi:eukaryotic-like serine/threonine-protein kinase